MAALPTIPQPPASPPKRGTGGLAQASAARVMSPKIVSHTSTGQCPPDEEFQGSDQDGASPSVRRNHSSTAGGSRSPQKQNNHNNKSSPISFTKFHSLTRQRNDFTSSALGMMANMKRKIEEHHSMEKQHQQSPPKTPQIGKQRPSAEQEQRPMTTGKPGQPLPTVAVQQQPQSPQSPKHPSVLGATAPVKFEVPKHGVVTRKPPPAEKFIPVFSATVEDTIEESDADKLRKTYNKRSPWDKTPLWRPLSRPGAQMLLDIKNAEAQGRAGEQHSPIKERTPGVTKASKLVNATQAKAVEFHEKVTQSLSPARSDTSFGLSDEELREEGELYNEEVLEMKNPSAYRPAGKNLLASQFCGETRNGASPSKQREQQKQFAWNRNGNNLAFASNLGWGAGGLVSGKDRAPSNTTISEMNNLMQSELETTGSTLCGSDATFSKDNELDRMNWMLHRKAERRKAQLAAKIVGGSVMPPGPDYAGVRLNFIVSHRHFCDSE